MIEKRLSPMWIFEILLPFVAKLKYTQTERTKKEEIRSYLNTKQVTWK